MATAPVTCAIASFIVRSSESDSAGYGCSLARISSGGKISGRLSLLPLPVLTRRTPTCAPVSRSSAVGPAVATPAALAAGDVGESGHPVALAERVGGVEGGGGVPRDGPAEGPAGRAGGGGGRGVRFGGWWRGGETGGRGGGVGSSVGLRGRVVAVDELDSPQLFAARSPKTRRAYITEAIDEPLVAAAATIGKVHADANLNSIGDITKMLVPFLGADVGRVIFGLGTIGAALVAAIVASLASAWGFGEVTGYRHSLEHRPLEAPWFYGIYSLAVIGGAILVDLAPNLVELNIGVEVMNALMLPLVLAVVAWGVARVTEAFRSRTTTRGFSDAVEAIADKAMERGTGARGLRAIIEEVLLNVMYDVPSREDIGKVVVTGEVVSDNVNPTLVPREDEPKKKKSA